MNLQSFIKREAILGQPAINIRREIALERESQFREHNVFTIDYPEWAKDMVR